MVKQFRSWIKFRFWKRISILKTNFNFENELQFWKRTSILKTNFNFEKIQMNKRLCKKDFVKKLVFNCNYPVVREHVNPQFLSLHQVSRERNAIPIWWKTRSTTLTKKVSNRCALGWNDTKSTRRVLGHSLVRSLVRSHHSLIRLLRTGRFARALIRSLRCAHSLACFAFASMEISLEHTQCRVCPLRSSIWRKKIVFNFFFFFFAFASMEVPLEDRQRRVRF